MASITFQFSRQADFGSRVIAWFAHGKWSHVDAIEADGRLYGARSDICGGIPAGVQSRRPDYANFAETKRVTITVTDEQVAVFWKFLYDQRGKPYDSMAIFSFMINRNWRDDDAWFCDELDLRGLELCKFFVNPLCLAANKMTPDDFLLVLSAVAPV
jgi:hypothetical protein